MTGAATTQAFVEAPSIPAEARADLFVLKAGSLFMCARPDGDIRPRRVSGEGLYSQDTRHISELRLSFGDVEPVALSHGLELGHRGVAHATNPTMADLDGHAVAQETLHLRRTLTLSDRLRCLVELRNFSLEPVRVPLTLWLSADFADVFEVRGVERRATRGEAVTPSVDRSRLVRFAYRGQDGLLRETRVELDPAPVVSDQDAHGRVRLDWDLMLAPRGGSHQLAIDVLPSVAPAGSALPMLDDAAGTGPPRLDAWLAASTSVRTDNELFQNVIAASMRDLHALLTPAGSRCIPAAGIPWYVAPFGRDSLLTCQQCMLVNPAMARDTLHVLAALQAQDDDAWRDAEPGKILHELRDGELARADLIPHTPYYGTADATPLFLALAGSYYKWTADLETMTRLRPAFDAALTWIDDYGDGDGDGFVEYERRSPAGLRNQGWKDSEDAIVRADGSLADGPIALVEVQGYVYLAKTLIADVYDGLGEPDRARALRGEAHVLCGAFNDAFWNADDGTFALALDGAKRQVTSVTSNPGHCLYCGIVDADKAPSVAERLMAPDMFSGWGVRTLSSDSPAYNPMSYHNGSVWPHDNAIVAAGLKRYGYGDATVRIASALFDVAARAPNNRLPELFCGFDRDGATAVDYPVACIPQAWAAAAPFMLLQAMLGIDAFAPAKTLTVTRPGMPSWLGHAELGDLRVGDARVSLGFARDERRTTFSLLQQHGDLIVTMAAGQADAGH